MPLNCSRVWLNVFVTVQPHVAVPVPVGITDAEKIIVWPNPDSDRKVILIGRLKPVLVKSETWSTAELFHGMTASSANVRVFDNQVHHGEVEAR